MIENEKKCSKCHIIKNICDFRKSKKGKHGVMAVCKICQSNIEKDYRVKNPNKSKESNKKSYEKNKQKYTEYRKKYYENNLSQLKKYWKTYRDSHIEKRCEYGKNWRESNKDILREKKKDYYLNNKEKINKKKNINTLLYNKKNPHIVCWRNVLRGALVRLKMKKLNKTIELLKYTPEQLKQRIECQFKEGMSWNNYGEWHVDHKKPISKFNANTPMHIVNSLSNLQPLWAKDNLIKSNKCFIFQKKQL